MSRWKAAGIHLLISAAIGALALTLVLGVWYPPPYFEASGGRGLTLLLIGVDLVLGPLITLVVFRAGKKGMRFDLAVIALVQLAALGYGMHVITQARPAFIVAGDNRFTLVSANEIDRKDLDVALNPEHGRIPWDGPKLVGVRLPQDQQARNALMAEILEGKEIETQPRYYVAYALVAGDLVTRSRPLADLRKAGPEASADIDAWLSRHARNEADVVWLPMRVREGFMSMLVDAGSGDVLGALPFDVD